MNIQDHMDSLDIILTRLVANDFTISPSKCD